MATRLLLMLGFALLSATGAGAFDMPKSVYRLAELDDAKADAVAKGRPITFVYTHEDTTCGLCANASLAAVDELKGRSVVVYADSNTEWDRIPRPVQIALRSPSTGKYIPKVVIMDAALDKVVAVVPYASPTPYAKLLKDAKKKIPKPEPQIPAGQKPLPPPATSVSSSVIPPDDNRPQRTWVSRAGKSVLASLVEQRKDAVVLKKSDGMQVEVSLDNLSDLDREYLQTVRNKLSGQLADSNAR